MQNYNPGLEALSITASPNVQAINAGAGRQQADGRVGSTAFALASALGTVGVQEGIATVQKQLLEQEHKAAEEFINSRTATELARDVREGKLPESASPVFRAQVHKIYGANLRDGLEAEVTGKLQAGEFKTPEDVDAYLTEQRNARLHGESEYATAGFDKGFMEFKAKAVEVHQKITNEKTVEEAYLGATDYMAGVVSKAYVLPPEEAATAIASEYQMLRLSNQIPKGKEKEFLRGQLSAVAATGNQKLLEAVLGSKLDNGVSMASVVGQLDSLQLAQHAETKATQVGRQQTDDDLTPFRMQAMNGELDLKGFEKLYAERSQFIGSATYASLIAHNQGVIAQKEQAVATHGARLESERQRADLGQLADIAVSNLEGSRMLSKEYQVLDARGNPTTVSGEDLVKESLKKYTKDQPLDQYIRTWANNGLIPDELKGEVQNGVLNLSEVGIDAKGKGIGTLTEAGTRAIELYRQVSAINPTVAQKLAGSDENAKTLSDIVALQEMGFPDVNSAASVINQVRTRKLAPSDWGNIKNQVDSATAKLTEASFFSTNWGQADQNTMAIKGTLKRRAELLMASGNYASGEAAINASLAYLSRPEVSTRINDTLYMNKDLPTAPAGGDLKRYWNNYLDEKVLPLLPHRLTLGDRLNETLTSVGAPDFFKLNADRKVATLVPQEGGKGRFIVMFAGEPLASPSGGLLEITRADMEEHFKSLHDSITANALSKKRLEQSTKVTPGRYSSGAIKN